MITSYEVGAVFKIINEASPQLTKMLRQVTELRAAIGKVATVKMPGLVAATGEVKALAAEWREVAKAAASANRSIGNASKRSLSGPGVAGVAEAQQMAAAWERIAAASIAVRGGRAALPPPPGAAGGGGGGRARLGNRIGMGGGGAGAYVGGPGVHIPGGGHINTHGTGMAGLGLLGYGVYQAMQYDDAVALMATHAGVDLTSNRDKFRKILEDAAVATGYGEHDVSAAAQQELRMFKYTPGEGNGISALPTMLRLAATESRLKGTSLEQSMEAETGLAHMVGKYSTEDVTKLAAAFSALSVSNPMSLKAQERAFGYAVPLLNAGIGIDPIQTMAASTALARAGITSTKAGTWIREMAVRAMPGTAIFESEKKALHHDELLKQIGLLDSNGKATWVDASGHGDLLKMLSTAMPKLAAMPPEQRLRAEKLLFGAQGSGAMAVLTEPVVQEQLKKIAADVKDPQSVARMQNFLGEYNRDSSLQNARTAMQTFNVTMADIGTKVLPSVNLALKDFKTAVEGVRNILPGASNGKGDAVKIGARVIEGAFVGGAAGSLLPGVGTLAGATAGGLAGIGLGVLEQSDFLKKGERPADRYQRRIEQLHQQKAPVVHQISTSTVGRWPMRSRSSRCKARNTRPVPRPPMARWRMDPNSRANSHGARGADRRFRLAVFARPRAGMN